MALSTSGFVSRGDVDEKVQMTATFTMDKTKESVVYETNVKAIPKTNSGIIDEAIADFELIEDNYVFRDLVMLPRVADMHEVHIDWATSNSSIIDLDGNVTRGDTDQEVTLTASFKASHEGVQSSAVKKTYKVTVAADEDDQHPTVINENAPGILRTVNVSDKDGLIAAIDNALPGDAIVLADGEYVNFIHTISKSGTKENPIYIYAQNNGKAKFTDVTYFNIDADYVTVANLLFTDGRPNVSNGVVYFNGEHSRLTNCVIDGFEHEDYQYRWVTMNGKYNEVDRNTFKNKSTSGNMVTVNRNNMDGNYHSIHLNYFYNFQNGGGNNGYEAIRVGSSTYSQSNAHVLVENNFFEEMNGEIEIISLKAGRIIVDNNTFTECAGLLTARHGKNNMLSNNIFFCGTALESGGIRAYDGGHIIRNNYIENATGSTSARGGIVIHAGINEPNATATLNLQWTPYNVLVENNTVLNCKQNISFDNEYTFNSWDYTLKNNLVYSDANALVVRRDHSNVTMINNEFFGATLSDDEDSGMHALALSQYKGSTWSYDEIVEKTYKTYSNTIGSKGLIAKTSSTVGAKH